jgi:LysR family transcriptional regulator, transcriptional activator of nhaA
VLPKRIAYRLIKPALQLTEPIRIVCRDGRTEKLLAELAVHHLDVVLSDAPIPSSVKIRAYNHLLGESKIAFMATDRLAAACRPGFPGSLNGMPVLLPTEDTVLRRALNQWFNSRGILPRIAGEIEDSGLLKAFGQAGVGIFAVPAIIQDEVGNQYGVEQVGVADDIIERFYAISLERKIRHPAVAMICQTARSTTFA